MQRADGRTTRFAHRRGELLKAAGDYVLDHGAGGMALRPLGAAIGVSHVALLHHFGSREQLFVEVLRELRERERRHLAARADGTAGADGSAADLETLVREMWGRLSAPDHERFMRLLFELVGRALQDPGGYGRFLHELVEDWTGSIEQLLLVRGAPAREAPQLATLLYGAIRGLLLDLVSTGDRVRVEAGFEALMDVMRPRFAGLEGGHGN
jgi:AcrR family transcriptional regulator